MEEERCGERGILPIGEFDGRVSQGRSSFQVQQVSGLPSLLKKVNVRLNGTLSRRELVVSPMILFSIGCFACRIDDLLSIVTVHARRLCLNLKEEQPMS